MKPDRPLPVIFYRSERNNEPVRHWLKGLVREDRKIIGKSMKKVQYGWPVGMPLVRKLDPDIWEVRTDLEGRTARVLFTIHENTLVLLHGFIKKSQKTPANDLKLAQARLSKLKGAL